VKRLRKPVVGFDLVKGPGGVEDWTVAPGTRQYYTQLNHTGSGLYPGFFIQDTLDINGITSQDKALFPSNIEVHQSPMYRAGGLPTPEPSNCAIEWLMITSVPFDVNAWISGKIVSSLPYRLPTVFGEANPSNLEVLSAGDCLYGRARYLQNQQDTPDRIAYSVREEFFGSLSPTMADELYITRIVAWVGLAPAAGALFTIPDLEFNIDAYLGEMSELSQIMELRRSYLTQQTIA